MNLKSWFFFQVKAFPCPKKGCAYKAKTDQDIQSHYRTHFADESYLCPYEDCNYSSKGKNANGNGQAVTFLLFTDIHILSIL